MNNGNRNNSNDFSRFSNDIDLSDLNWDYNPNKQNNPQRLMNQQSLRQTQNQRSPQQRPPQQRPQQRPPQQRPQQRPPQQRPPQQRPQNNDQTQSQQRQSQNRINNQINPNKQNNQGYQQQNYSNMQRVNPNNQYNDYVNGSIQMQTNNNRGNKVFAVVAVIAMLILTVIIGIFAYKIIFHHENRYIEANGPVNLTDKTIDELMNYTFEVKKGNKKCDLEQTDWYLNNELIASDTSKMVIPLDKLTWGTLVLRAVNGNGKEGDKLETSSVDFSIKLVRDTNSSGTIHKSLSKLNQLPSDVIDKLSSTSIFELNDELLSNSKAISVNPDGSFRSVYNDSDNHIKLEIDEYTPLRYYVDTTKRLNESYVLKEVTLIIDRNNTKQARLIMDLTGIDMPFDSYFYRYYNGEVYELSNYSITSSQVVCEVNESGTYFISSKNIDTIRNGIKQLDIFFIDMSDPMTSIGDWRDTLEIGELKTELSGSIYKDQYDDIVDALLTRLDTRNNGITTNVYSYNSTLIEEIKGINSNTTSLDTIETYDFNNTELLPYILSRLQSENNIFKRSIVFVLNNKSFKNNSDIVMKLNTLCNESNNDFSVTILSVNSNEKNLQAFIDNSEAKCLDVNYAGDTVKAYKIIGRVFEKGYNDTIKIDDEYKAVIALADNGFEFGKNNISSLMKYETSSNLTEAYGTCRLIELAYTGTVSNEILNLSNTLGDLQKSHMPEAYNYQGRLGLQLSKDKLDKLNTGDMQNIDIDYSEVINVLNDEIHRITYSDNIEYFNENTNKFISYLTDEINKGKPVILGINSDFGSSTVLANRVYNDMIDPQTYYIGVYDPMEPDSEKFIKVETFTSVNEYIVIKGCRVHYNSNNEEFTDIFRYISIK